MITHRFALLCLLGIIFISCSDQRHSGTGLETSTIQLSIKTNLGQPAAYIHVQSFPSGQRLQTDSLGVLIWDTTGQKSLYAGGYREAAILPHIPAMDTDLNMGPVYSIRWDSPVQKNLSIAQAPNLHINHGDSVLTGIPLGQWTLVEQNAENPLQWPLSISESSIDLDSSLGSVQITKSTCGITQGKGDIAPSKYCWFTKVDTVLPGDSIEVQSTGPSLSSTFYADSNYGDPNSVVALALRFGSQRIPVDLTRLDSISIYADFADGDSMVVSIVTFDGTLYGFWNQLLYGQGTDWYALSMNDFQLSHWGGGTAPLSHAIGIDFTLPGSSRGVHTLQLDSIVW